jgi:cytochrome c553
MTTLRLMLILAAVACLSTAAFAEEKAEAPDLSKMNGQDLYKSICKPCHNADSDAGEYTPMTLIMDQWDEFFADTFVETHKELTCPKDESKKVLDVLDKDMIKKIHEFCVDHAADSESPMTCG